MYGLLALKPKWVLDLRYASLYPAAALNTAIWKRLMLATRSFDRERHMSCQVVRRSYLRYSPTLRLSIYLCSHSWGGSCLLRELQLNALLRGRRPPPITYETSPDFVRQYPCETPTVWNLCLQCREHEKLEKSVLALLDGPRWLECK